MDTFTTRDLRERTGELLRDAETVKLFDDEVISLGKAARLAGLPQGEFIDHLGALKIPVVRYGKEELQRELADFE